MKEVPAHFGVIKAGFFDWRDAWVDQVLVNLIWVLSWLTIVLGPPATFGLYYVAQQVARGTNPGPRGLVEGARRYFLTSWLWMLLNLVALVIVVTNVWFYGRFEGRWTLVLQILFGFLGLTWLVVQFYALPYVMEQNRKHLGLALRNGLFTALAAPLYTLFIVGVAFLVAALSIATVVLLFLGGPALIAALGTRAVLDRLAAYQVRERDAQRAAAVQRVPGEEQAPTD